MIPSRCLVWKSVREDNLRDVFFLKKRDHTCKHLLNHRPLFKIKFINSFVLLLFWILLYILYMHLLIYIYYIRSYCSTHTFIFMPTTSSHTHSSRNKRLLFFFSRLTKLHFFLSFLEDSFFKHHKQALSWWQYSFLFIPIDPTTNHQIFMKKPRFFSLIKKYS